MKYAFLFGSNAFIVERPVITYVQDGNVIELLHIKSLYSPATPLAEAHSLVVDTNITDVNGYNVALTNNEHQITDYKVHRSDNQIHVTDKEGHFVLDVLQLGDDALPGLSSHVLNELSNTGPAHVIRFRGDFMIGQHRISIDNEKLYIDDDVYAESVQVGQNGVQLSPKGVLV